MYKDIRHSFASQLILKGASIRAVQELLGHSDIRMTQKYANLEPRANQDAVNLLDPEVEPEPEFGPYLALFLILTTLKTAIVEL